MINIENELFSLIAKKIREIHKKAFVVGEYVPVPSKFPCVSIIEMDNAVYEKTSSNDYVENHAKLLYEVNVYSNKKTGKKAECKEIITLIDNEFLRRGFTRIMMNPIPNMDKEANVYRMVARYRAVVSKEKEIYRR